MHPKINKFNFSILKKLKNQNTKKIKKFFSGYIKNYIKLDKRFNFNEEINKKYIFNQLKNIKFQNKPLKYLPIGIKDNINTKILSTNFGLKNKKKFKIGNNARVVDKIIENGGIVFSKTKCAEFAVHHIGKKFNRNPYNNNHIAGTSSTGSAISVSVDALPITIGTQTAGSIIRPASFCGVYGFKPTYGAIDRTGILKTNDLFDTVGLLSKEIKLISLLFKTLIDCSTDYPWTKKYFLNYKKYKKKNTLKIGYFDENFKIYGEASKDVKIFYNIIINLLKNKFHLKKFNINKMNDLHKLHEIAYNKSLSYYIKNYSKNKSSISKALRKITLKGEKITTKRYNLTIKKIFNYKKLIKNQLSKFDYLIIPSTFTRAPKINNSEKKDSSLIWTTLGVPCITIPVEISKEKLPYGLMIVTNDYNDLSLLDISKKIDLLIKRKFK